MSAYKIDHVGISVRDIQQARAFFSEAFGLTFSQPTPRDELDLIMCMDELGIELIAPMSPDGYIAKSIESRGEGLSLLSLRVVDMAASIEQLEALGARVTMRMVIEDREIATLSPKRTFGAPIQLVEYDDHRG